MRYLQILLIFLFVHTISASSGDFFISRTSTFADARDPEFSGLKGGDTIWIEAGTREGIQFRNFHGERGKPIVFANRIGQVIIETEMNYGLSFWSCSYFKLSGLRGQGYHYGFFIAKVDNPSGMGISADYKSTDLEIENCEVSHTGFAGIMAKTNPDCKDPETLRFGFTQYNTIIHDCYIHDTGGEGMYIGHTSYSGATVAGCADKLLPSVLVGTRIYNNRVERTGYDGIQVASAVRDCDVHDNVLVDCSLNQIDSQMGGITLGGGTQARCYNNIVTDCYGTGIQVFGKGGTIVFNNVIIRAGKRYKPDNQEEPEEGVFLSDKTNDDKSFYGVYNNTIIQPKSDGIRIDNTVNFEVLIYNNAIIGPGAFDHYENDNTDRTGTDSYIYDTGRFGFTKSAANYFTTSVEKAGFENPSGDDYHLTATSPLIDTGKDLSGSGITADLDGHPRPIGRAFDAGAYEYYGSQSVAGNAAGPDFRLSSLRIGTNGQLNLGLQGFRQAGIRIRLVDLLGQELFMSKNLEIESGNNELCIPAKAQGLLLLIIQTDRSNYARKIVIL